MYIRKKIREINHEIREVCLNYHDEWPPLNCITDNGINQLIRSNIFQLRSPKLLSHTKYIFDLFAYCYQLVILIELP